MFAGSTMTAPCAFMSAMAGVGDRVGRRAVAEQPRAHDADARALQPVRIEERRVVAERPARARLRRRVVGVGAGHRAEDGDRVGDGARHRAGGVLGVRDRHDARAAEQADGRLDADERVVVRRRDDRAVGLRADRRPPQKPAASAAPEPELEPDGLRSSAYGFLVWPPRPLQPLDECVDRKLAHSLRFVLPRMTAPAFRSAATMNASFGGFDPTSASEPAVVCMRSAVAMLSLMRIGMPCSGPRGPRLLRSASSCVGDLERVGVGLEHGVERRPVPVQRVDAVEKLLHERVRCLLTARHALLQFGDGRIRDVGSRRGRLAGRLERMTTRAGGERHEGRGQQRGDRFDGNRSVSCPSFSFHGDDKGPREAGDHQDGARPLRDARDLVIAVQRSGELEDVFPVVPFDFRARCGRRGARAAARARR